MASSKTNTEVTPFGCSPILPFWPAILKSAVVNGSVCVGGVGVH